MTNTFTMKSVKLLATLMLFSITGLAQDTTDTSTEDPYFETYNDYFLIKTNLSNRTLNLALAPRANGITQYQKSLWYNPTVQNAFGIGIKFKNISLSHSFKLTQTNLVRNAFGTSRYSDTQLRSYGKRLGYDIYYQNFESFYVTNLETLLDNIQLSDPFPRRDDLTVRNIGANIFYVFNPERFSYAAAFQQSTAQLKSGGSFILNLSMGYTRSSADSSFIPSDIEIEFAPEANFNDVWFGTTVICPGYAYTYVHKTGIYGSLGATPGIGIVYQEATGDVPTERQFNYFLKGIGRAAIGFNNEKWTFGASLTTDVQAINFDDIQFRNNNLNISVFAGYRIKTKFMADKTSVFDFSKKKKETE